MLESVAQKVWMFVATLPVVSQKVCTRRLKKKKKKKKSPLRFWFNFFFETLAFVKKKKKRKKNVGSAVGNSNKVQDVSLNKVSLSV